MDIREAVREFIRENFYVERPEAIGEDTSLLEAGIVDSTGVLEIIAFLEREFAIVVEDEETIPENLDSVGRIHAFVVRKLRASTAVGG
jgi:acyl carrier protein